MSEFSTVSKECIDCPNHSVSRLAVTAEPKLQIGVTQIWARTDQASQLVLLRTNDLHVRQIRVAAHHTQIPADGEPHRLMIQMQNLAAPLTRLERRPNPPRHT